MSESLKELKSIVAAAPNSKTMVCSNGHYWNDEDLANLAISCDSINGVLRSISDINRIIEMMEIKSKSNPAKEECKHSDTITHWNYHQCKSCGYVLTDSDFGCASRKWFPNIEAARFYQRNGFLPGEERDI